VMTERSCVSPSKMQFIVGIVSYFNCTGRLQGQDLDWVIGLQPYDCVVCGRAIKGYRETRMNTVQTTVPWDLAKVRTAERTRKTLRANGLAYVERKERSRRKDNRKGEG